MITFQGHGVKYTNFHIFNDYEKSIQIVFVKQDAKYLLYYGVYAYCFA